MATGSITWAGAQQASTAHWLPVKVSKDCALSTEELASLIQDQDAVGEAQGMHATLEPIPVWNTGDRSNPRGPFCVDPMRLSNFFQVICCSLNGMLLFKLL